MAESTIVDIFNGKVISAWKDEDYIYLAFPYCTVNIPAEEFEDVAKELQAIVTTWKAGESKN